MLQPPPVVATELHPPPPVLLVASALTLLPEDFFRKIPFSGDFFLHARLLTVATLFPADNLPMSITSRVSLDGLRRPPPELETPLTPFLNFNFKRDLKPCAAELAVDEDADDVSVVPFDGGTQPRFLLLVLLLLLLLFITESSLVLTPTDRHVLGGLG